MPELTRRPKLLLTGSTPIQVGSEKTQLKILTSVRSWREAFVKLGYDVTWRPVVPGENLAAFHRVVVSLNKPNSIASRHVHGALWCLAKRPDAVVLLDDWQADELVNDIRCCAEFEERLFRLHGGKIQPNLRSQILKVSREMSSKPWRWPVISPILGHGDPSLLKVPGKLFPLDPTAFTKRYLAQKVDKARVWVQASLLKKPPPATGWPSDSYGWRNASKGLGGTGQLAQRRLTEPELMRVYDRSWGVVSPAHPHAGSGWWRVRYLMSADAGCVLSADSREAGVLGEPYLRASNPAAVEGLSDGMLRRWALDQRDCLESVVMPEEEVLDKLSAVLKAAKQGR